MAKRANRNMLSEQLGDNHYHRYERKFFISELTKQEVEFLVKQHPAMFTEIFHQRFVNNIYFDSVGLKNYYDNIDGSTFKRKVRIRWYGELFGPIKKPVLEFKIKDGFVGKKESFLLNAFELNNHGNILTTSNIIEESDIPEIIKMELKFLKPVLLNRYTRRYFQSADKNYRITLDTDLVFYWIGGQYNSFLNKLKNDINIILEVKYDSNMDHNANSITANFPFRLSRSSKYVIGINGLYVP